MILKIYKQNINVIARHPVYLNILLNHPQHSVTRIPTMRSKTRVSVGRHKKYYQLSQDILSYIVSLNQTLSRGYCSSDSHTYIYLLPETRSKAWRDVEIIFYYSPTSLAT